MQKSKYILGLIDKAMRDRETKLAEPATNSVFFQISCQPKEKQRILNYCKENLEPRSRSRWIVNIILEGRSRSPIN